MSQIDGLTGGQYIFFQSMASNKALSSRLSSVSSKLSGGGGGGDFSLQKSEKYIEFSNFMKSYLSKLQSIAATMRAAEMAFIDDSISKLDKDKAGLINADIKAGLDALRTGTINEKNYQAMIAALNAIKYQNDIEHFKTAITEQKTNIAAIKANLEDLKKIDEDEYNSLTQDYKTNYGKYIDRYANTMRQKLDSQFRSVQKTYLQKLADKINNVLTSLSTFEGIEDIVGRIWQANPNATTATEMVPIDQTNAIVETVVQRVMANPDVRPSQLVKDIINDLEVNPSVILQNKDGEASKVFTKKQNRKKTFEEAINDNKRILGKMLLEAENAEEMIKHICGTDSDKANDLIARFNDLKQQIESVPKSEQNTWICEHFDLEARESLMKTQHMADFNTQLSKNVKLKTMLNDGFTIKPEQIVKGLSGKLQIRITKSAAQELVGHYQNQIVDCVFNNVPGSINMKDDVYAAIKLASANVQLDENEISKELEPVIDQIDKAIREYMADYIEVYASREDNAKDRKGTTNVKRARDIYITKMQGLYDTIKGIVDKYPNLAHAIEDYAKNTDTFLSSISAKNYTLYNNEIGFHAGTLGPGFKLGDTTFKALENIQQMYLSGGISTIDMGSLEFALLNCSPYAIGAGLKPALESYLLGGAALMVFDEGFGEAIPYLQNMEAQIDALMPKNLNLYLLNEAYVPASYIITSIYTNLSKFYGQELAEGYEDFTARNRVIITNNASEALIPKSGSLQERFAATAAAAWSQIDIQFVFMAGMLEIFNNLGAAFNVT